MGYSDTWFLVPSFASRDSQRIVNVEARPRCSWSESRPRHALNLVSASNGPPVGLPITLIFAPGQSYLRSRTRANRHCGASLALKLVPSEKLFDATSPHRTDFGASVLAPKVNLASSDRGNN